MNKSTAVSDEKKDKSPQKEESSSYFFLRTILGPFTLAILAAIFAAISSAISRV